MNRSLRPLLVALTAASTLALAQEPSAPTSPPAEPAAPAAAPAKDPAAAQAATSAKEQPPAAAPAKAPSLEVVRPKPSPPTPATSPAPAAPINGMSPTSDEYAVYQRARAFFSDLLLADARSAVANASFPFFLEGERFDDPDQLQQKLLKNLRAKRTDLLVLYGIEILTPAQMEQKYGKPPARLSNLPLRDKGTFIAVANLSGHAAIAVYRPAGNSFRVVAYHD